MYKSERVSIAAAEICDVKANLKIDLRSLLCSSKDGLSERELRNDYRELMGKEIPYSLLGYIKLYDMMRDFTDVCTIRKHFTGNTWIYYPVHDQKTAELGMLVYGQVDKNRSIREKRRVTEYNKSTSYNNYYNNSFYNTSYNRNSALPNQYNPPAPSTIPNAYLPANIQSQIKSILLLADDYCLNNIQFEKEYLKRYIHMLNPASYGFGTYRQMLESLTHLVKIEPLNKGSSSSYDEYMILLKENNSEESQAEAASNVNGFQTWEEVVIENLKNIIKSAGEAGIYLADLLDEYVVQTGKSLEYEKLGYHNLYELVDAKLSGFVEFETENEHRIYYSEKATDKSANKDKEEHANSSSLSESDLDEFEKNDEDKEASNLKRLEELEELIHRIVKSQPESKVNMKEFFDLFERHYGWCLNYKDYGFSSNCQFIAELSRLNYMKVDFFNYDNFLVIFPGRRNGSIETKKPRSQNNNQIVSETWYFRIRVRWFNFLI